MSCGQIALTELGCFPDKYYASEVDKFAIQQTMSVFPDTIQLGDVTKVDVSQLDKIDLLIGGSPCQSFSFAGKQVGMVTTNKVDITDLQTYLDLKEMGFEFEGQSYLFWEYMRILTDIRKYNPDVKFLLENVVMAKKWEAVLTRAIQGMINHTEKNMEKGNSFGARVVSPDGKANTLLQRCYKDGKDNLLLEWLRELSPRVAGVTVTTEGIRPHRGTPRNPD